jgi:hypothetical protein
VTGDGALAACGTGDTCALCFPVSSLDGVVVATAVARPAVFRLVMRTRVSEIAFLMMQRRVAELKGRDAGSSG